MHPRIAEISALLDRTRRELLAAVPVQLAPADLARRPSSGAWSIAEILDHLATVETSVARLVDKMVTRAVAAGLTRETSTASVLPTFDGRITQDRARRIDAPDIVRPRAGVSAAEARAALDRSREALREAMAHADGYDLGLVSAPHAVLGPLTLYQWLIFIAHHELRHIGQIAEAAATGGRVGARSA